MDHHALWILPVLLLGGIVYTVLDIRYERKQIARFLNVGGARILQFRWKPFLGWMGADSKSKHYEVTFEEHSGRIIRAIFTYTSGLGVMKTSDRILREPVQAEAPAEDTAEPPD